MALSSALEKCDSIEEKNLSVNEQIGQILREARESQNISIEKAADFLKIRKFFLQSIETGCFEQLPGTVYTAWFIRSYAKYLKIDADIVLEQFSSFTSDAPLKAPPAILSDSSPNSLLTRKAVWISLFLTIGLGAVIYFYSHHEKTDFQAPSVLPVEEEKSIVEKQNTEEFPEQSPARAETSALTEENAAEIVIAAVKDTWIKITDAEGQVLAARRLYPGERYRVLDQSGLKLTVGDVSALEVYLGDKQVHLRFATAEESGVVKDFPLDSGSLKNYISDSSELNEAETASE